MITKRRPTPQQRAALAKANWINRRRNELSRQLASDAIAMGDFEDENAAYSFYRQAYSEDEAINARANGRKPVSMTLQQARKDYATLQGIFIPWNTLPTVDYYTVKGSTDLVAGRHTSDSFFYRWMKDTPDNALMMGDSEYGASQWGTATTTPDAYYAWPACEQFVEDGTWDDALECYVHEDALNNALADGWNYIDLMEMENDFL